jgi:GTP-binding protein Era
VCIIGLPNAGKSTLLNALAGEKLAIVSPKPQTTRTRVLGVIHVPKQKGRPGAQVILIDTPGVHRTKSSLGRKMMAEVREALEGCDVVLMITDAARKHDTSDEFVVELVKKSNTTSFLLLNKIDLLKSDKGGLLPVIQDYAALHRFQEIIPISARKREGLDILLKKLIKALPQGSSYFPEDQVTDQPARFMAAELIREQVLLATSQEIPHSTAVVVEQFEEGPTLTRIAAIIFCERESQKRILIGHGGQMLKKIGTAARLENERMLGRKVFLELFVKVRENWRDSRQFVEDLDWRRQLENLVTR